MIVRNAARRALAQIFGTDDSASVTEPSGSTTVVPSEKADRTLVFGGVTLVREPINFTVHDDGYNGWRWRVLGPGGLNMVAAWRDRAGKIYSGSLYNVWIALPQRCCHHITVLSWLGVHAVATL